MVTQNHSILSCSINEIPSTLLSIQRFACKSVAKFEFGKNQNKPCVTTRFFVRVLVELEEVVNEQWEDRDGRKKMSKSNAKSLGSLRQKHRKYIKVI